MILLTNHYDLFLLFPHETWYHFLFPPEKCLLSNNINEYNFVAQGKTSIPGVDDSEEFRITDVSAFWTGHSRYHFMCYLIIFSLFY